MVTRYILGSVMVLAIAACGDSTQEPSATGGAMSSVASANAAGGGAANLNSGGAGNSTSSGNGVNTPDNTTGAAMQGDVAGSTNPAVNGSQSMPGTGGAQSMPGQPQAMMGGQSGSNSQSMSPSGDAGGSSAGGTAMDMSPMGNAGSASAPDELPTADAAPVISNLMIEPNPNSTISAYVSWQTDQPANSEVQFGVGDVEFKITQSEAVTEHRVLVWGMHATTEYVIRAISANSEGSDMSDDSFTTQALPSEVPIVELTANEPDSSQSGWTLTNIMVGSPGAGFGSSSPAVAVIYDELGEVVWYYINGTTADTRGDISMDYLDTNTVLVGPAPGESPHEIDMGGNTVWAGPQQSGQQMTHHAGRLTNGNTVVIREQNSGGITGAVLEEYTPDDQLAWSWTLFDHIDVPASASGDWCHANSVTMDLDNNIGYMNCRFVGLFKFDRDSGDVIWHMGAKQTPDLPGDFTYIGTNAQFNDDHDPELHDDGTILMYDNGGFAGLGGGGTYHSRVVEYAVDQDAKTAELVWEFPGNFDVDAWYKNDWYASYWGDADRLENNNVLITIGLKATDLQTRILEVTRDGKIVWEITMPANQGSYRAQRMSPPPIERL